MVSAIKLGLRENWKQFSLLVIVNAFVGSMVGLERTILPIIAESEFHIASRTFIFSFIIVFGVVKAFTNFLTGSWANRFGRKKLLIAGWIFGLPVPFILMYSNSWNWIIAANVLLGINQGLAWSSTVMMKIDLVGERQRGLAMGINEFAGYVAVAATAFGTGWIASNYGIRPYPFVIGVVVAIAGLVMSIIFIEDTITHFKTESLESKLPRLKNVFLETTFWNKNLSSVTLGGLINNLNDGMIWGFLPVLLSLKGFSLTDVGIIVAIYPMIWGFTQLFTGPLADRYCKRDLLTIGMALQGFSILMMTTADSFLYFIVLLILLGMGTALVYPTFLASVAENTNPLDRANSLGVFRFWRDLGYAIGALITGIVVDIFGLNAPVILIGSLTVMSSFLIYHRMTCNQKSKRIIIAG